jgi:hypothetical protein
LRAILRGISITGLAALFLTASVATAGGSGASAARTAPTTASGTAYVTSRTITSARQVGAYTIVTSVDTLVLTGTVTGTATEPDVLIIGPSGAFTFFGVITGDVTIAGRSGQVVASAVGTGDAGATLTANARYHLLSGTGDLADLRLELTSVQTGPVATYSGEYQFGADQRR